MREVIFKFIVGASYLLIPLIGFSDSLKPDSVYQLQSRWKNQNSEIVSIEKFRGAPVVLTMLYTSCQDACPMIIADMQRIEKDLPVKIREKIQFAAFSFDPVRDTPDKLNAFARAHALDLDHWTLLTGNANAVRNLAAALGIRYRKLRNGDFSHSSVITVLDSEGVVRFQQSGLRKPAKDITAAIQSLSK